MAILSILQYPDPRLKAVGHPVDNIQDPRIQSMIDDMMETLLHTDHCGGLAACQLDIKNPARIFVYYDFENDNEPDKQTPMVVVNPIIIETEGEVLEHEGCMSVCNASAMVRRPAKTTIQGLDRNGTPFTRTRTGYLAKLFQHEVDHLNGKLYIDYLSPLKRKMMDEKIEKELKKRKK